MQHKKKQLQYCKIKDIYLHAMIEEPDLKGYVLFVESQAHNINNWLMI